MPDWSYEKGISDGKANNLNKNIRNMYKKGYDIEIIKLNS